jgi:hypothetical protein
VNSELLDLILDALASLEADRHVPCAGMAFIFFGGMHLGDMACSQETFNSLQLKFSKGPFCRFDQYYSGVDFCLNNVRLNENIIGGDELLRAKTLVLVASFGKLKIDGCWVSQYTANDYNGCVMSELHFRAPNNSAKVTL